MSSPEQFQWFAASAVIIGATASIFRPDNKLCPVDLPPAARAFICVALGAIAGGLQMLVAGASWQDAAANAVAAILSGFAWQGVTPDERGPK